MDEKADGEQGLADSGLEELDRRFSQWRDSCRQGERIPAQLWAAAAQMAREHGVSRIATRLRLNTVALKRHMHAGEGQPAGASAPEFVELIAAASASVTTAPPVAHECVIELQNAHGAKMRVELNGPGLAGLAHLCSGFWNAA
jgi:hypothetical protein